MPNGITVTYMLEVTEHINGDKEEDISRMAESRELQEKYTKEIKQTLYCDDVKLKNMKYFVAE